MSNQWSNGFSRNSSTNQTSSTQSSTTTDNTSKPEMEVIISADKMEAYVKIKLFSPDQPVHKEDIIHELKIKKIKYGILEDEIEKIVLRRNFFNSLLCAKGKRPIDGQDGVVNFNFEQNRVLKPTELEDGSVDYHDLNLINSAERGQVLCTIDPPKDGVDGIDIFGNVAPFTPGKMPGLPAGTNTVESEDKMHLFAAIDGCISVKGGIVNVDDVFTVRGDVDNSSGNINFSGTVVVYGDVRESFSITCDKDVVVNGTVEGANITAGGNVTVSAGMNGMNRGTVNCGGCFQAKYVESAVINAGGNVTSDIIVGSKVSAGGKIYLKGRRGALIGGRHRAGLAIIANTIGSESYTETDVAVGSDEELQQAADNCIVKERAALKKEKEDLLKNVNAIQDKLTMVLSAGQDMSNPVIKQVVKAKEQLLARLAEIEDQIQKQRESQKSYSQYKIVAFKKACPGVKMSIGPFSQIINQDNINVKFVLDEDGITTAPTNISDKE